MLLFLLGTADNNGKKGIGRRLVLSHCHSFDQESFPMKLGGLVLGRHGRRRVGSGSRPDTILATTRRATVGRTAYKKGILMIGSHRGRTWLLVRVV